MTQSHPFRLRNTAVAGASAMPLACSPGSHSPSACRVASCGWPIATTKPWRRATASASASLRRTELERLVVVQKDVAHDRGHAHLLRDLVADRLRRGARIEEHQAASLELAQHRLHAGPEGGEAAAHVVVDADIAVEAVERRRRALLDLGVAQRHQERIGAGIGATGGLHRQMQEEFVAPRPRGARLVAQILGVGQERHGERARQLPGTLRARPVDADIVDHDGDQRPAVEVGEGHGVLAPGLGTRDGSGKLLRFGSSRFLVERRKRLTRFCLGVFRQAGQVFDARVFRRRFAGRAALHLLQRVARQPIAVAQFESLGDPVAAEQAGHEQQHQAADDRVPAMGVDPCDDGVKALLQPLAQRRSRFRTLSVRLPASVLPRRHLSFQP